MSYSKEKKVVEWFCSFCHRKDSHQFSTEVHERHCHENPDYKGCSTCEYLETEPDEIRREFVDYCNHPTAYHDLYEDTCSYCSDHKKKEEKRDQ